jgi:hypothetical protein
MNKRVYFKYRVSIDDCGSRGLKFADYFIRNRIMLVFTKEVKMRGRKVNLKK